MDSESVSFISHGEPEKRSIRRHLQYMVRHSLPFGVHIPTNDPFYSKDSLSFLIIVYSAKHRGPARAHGAPNLLDKILRDATTYFLVIFTGQLLAIFFVIFAPVRDRPTDLCLLPPD